MIDQKALIAAIQAVCEYRGATQVYIMEEMVSVFNAAYETVRASEHYYTQTVEERPHPTMGTTVYDVTLTPVNEQPDCRHIYGAMADWPRPCMTCGKNESEVSSEQISKLLNPQPNKRESGSEVDRLLSKIIQIALRNQRECEGQSFSAFRTIIGLIYGYRSGETNQIEGGE